MRPWKRTGKTPKPSVMESHTKYHPLPKIERRTATNHAAPLRTPRIRPPYRHAYVANKIRLCTPMAGTDNVSHAHANIIARDTPTLRHTLNSTQCTTHAIQPNPRIHEITPKFNNSRGNGCF